MNDATEAVAAQDNSSPTEHGKMFIRWGLSLFTLGLIVGLIPILHYMHGTER